MNFTGLKHRKFQNTHFSLMIKKIDIINEQLIDEDSIVLM